MMSDVSLGEAVLALLASFIKAVLVQMCFDYSFCFYFRSSPDKEHEGKDFQLFLASHLHAMRFLVFTSLVICV